ncbi:PE domain-containing protein [Pseudonocardia sp.]|uniref:PE domain-containing protein n=1 Tax=Pseudonocardia sp. TaxID=60912 RepID=UPI003D0AB4B5
MGGHDIVADPAALRRAAAELDRVASGVEEYAVAWSTQRIWQRVADVGTDPVSLQLKQNLITMAENAGRWMVGYSRQVRAAQEGLLAQAEAYERVEREAADRMRRL